MKRDLRMKTSRFYGHGVLLTENRTEKKTTKKQNKKKTLPNLCSHMLLSGNAASQNGSNAHEGVNPLRPCRAARGD